MCVYDRSPEYSSHSHQHVHCSVVSVPHCSPGTRGAHWAPPATALVLKPVLKAVVEERICESDSVEVFLSFDPDFDPEWSFAAARFPGPVIIITITYTMGCLSYTALPSTLSSLPSVFNHAETIWNTYVVNISTFLPLEDIWIQKEKEPCPLFPYLEP